VRAYDNANYYFLLWNLATGGWAIRKLVAGVSSVVTGNPTQINDTVPSPGNGRLVVFEVANPGFTVKLYGNDGITLLGERTTTDNSITGSHPVGWKVFGNQDNGAHIDFVSFV
jgi:hypothetical protein